MIFKCVFVLSLCILGWKDVDSFTLHSFSVGRSLDFVKDMNGMINPLASSWEIPEVEDKLYRSEDVKSQDVFQDLLLNLPVASTEHSTTSVYDVTTKPSAEDSTGPEVRDEDSPQSLIKSLPSDVYEDTVGLVSDEDNQVWPELIDENSSQSLTKSLSSDVYDDTGELVYDEDN